MTWGGESAPQGSRERGSVSIELVLLFPLALTMLFLAVQGAVYYQGRTVALASAQEGARGGAALGAHDNDARLAAEDFARTAGGDGILGSPDVAVQRGPESVTVTVTGKTLSVIPGWDPEVTQSATRPIERNTAPLDPVNPEGPPPDTATGAP